MCYPGVRLALSLSLSPKTSSSPCLFPPLSDTIDSWPNGLSLSFPWVFPEFLPVPSLGKDGLCGDMDDEPQKLFLILRSQLFPYQLPLEVSHRGLPAEGEFQHLALYRGASECFEGRGKKQRCGEEDGTQGCTVIRAHPLQFKTEVLYWLRALDKCEI